MLRRTNRLNPEHVNFFIPRGITPHGLGGAGSRVRPPRSIYAGVPVGPPAVPDAPACKPKPEPTAMLTDDCCQCCHGPDDEVFALQEWVAPNQDVDTSPVPSDNPWKGNLDECLGEIRDLQLWLDMATSKHEELMIGDTDRRNGRKDRVDRLIKDRDFCFDGQARNLVRRSLVLVDMKKDLMELITEKNKADDAVDKLRSELREHRPKDALLHYREREFIESQRLNAGCVAVNRKLKDLEAVQQLWCFVRARCDLEFQKARCIADSLAVRCGNGEAQVARARDNMETGLTAAMQDVNDQLLLCPRGPCVHDID